MLNWAITFVIVLSQLLFVHFQNNQMDAQKTKHWLKIASFWSCGEMGLRFKFLLIGYKALVLALVLANDNFVAIFFFFGMAKRHWPINKSALDTIPNSSQRNSKSAQMPLCKPCCPLHKGKRRFIKNYKIQKIYFY